MEALHLHSTATDILSIVGYVSLALAYILKLWWH
jgi:hypothetical protein